MSEYTTIQYETSADKVATITLDRPEVLNAFDRTMCEEMRDAWHRVKADAGIHAVVLRAAGDRAFCAGLDTKKPYGQPDDVWNHEDPGELLSPKWQKVWKPVVAAVQGICTAGAFYFLNEADIVICSPDATFFDSHVTFGMVSALEPVGLMRRIGLAQTLRIALTGNDERVSAETAVQLGLVTEIVGREQLWPRGRDAGNRARDLGVARPPLPRRDGTGPRLHTARQPDRDGRGEGAAAAPARAEDPLVAFDLSQRIADILAIDPSAGAIEFAGRWYTWGELETTVDAVAAEIPRRAEVGVLLRNRPASIGLMLGVLRAGGCVVTVNPQRGTDRTRDDLRALDLGFVAGEPSDLATLLDPDARATRLALDDLGATLCVARGTASDVATRPGVAVRMLTSGTTGPPKRIDLTYDTLARVLVGAKYYESNQALELRLRSGVAVVNSPLVHLGGLFRVLQCVGDGRPFCFLEKFTVDAWVDAVRRHRPATASLVPAALRMVLEAEVDPADLASLRSVVSGTAPLSPDDADAFTARFGVPVLVSYAATEFGGAVAGWNVADHREFWTVKRGSVGRAHPGHLLRVVDPDTGAELGTDEIGILEVQTSHLGPSSPWLQTTDLARIDADGFVFICGRADQAIIRGGFKVHPDDVRAALERHPRVRGAAVVAKPDPRVGAVPVAAVELRPGSEPFTVDDLLAHASSLLARYELPAEILIVDELPRTASAKVDLGGVRALFDAAPEGAR
jgi:long-chain acyl-CoA synthetase